MSFLSRSLATFAALAGLATSTWAPASASRGGLPAVASPAGLRSVDDAGGGRILVGSLGAVAPDGDPFRAGLRRIGGYFGHSLHLDSVVRSTDGRITMGVFDANLAGVRVGGLALTSSGANAAQVAAIFDRSDRLPHTIGALAAHLQRLTPPLPEGMRSRSTAQSAGPSLQSLIAAVPTGARTSNDGTVSIGVPAGWDIKRLAEGAAVVDGPDGAEIVCGMVFPMVDPRGPAGMGIRLPYEPDPARAYQKVVTALLQMGGQGAPQFLTTSEKPVAAPGGIRAAEVTGTSIVRGKTLRYDEFVGVGPQGQMGGWLVSVSGAVAPVDRFERDEPEMGALMESYRIDNGRRQAQVAASIANGWAQSRAGIAHMNAVTATDQRTVDASMQNARNVQDGIDRSTAGFVHYLNGSDVVENASGAHFNTSAEASQMLTSFDPQHYRSVPVTQYVKGVDY